MNAELRSQSTDDFCLLIDGNLVAGAATLNVINPATEEVVAVCPRADLSQLNQAVAAAKTAFATWKDVPIGKRRQLVGKVADALESRRAEFARLLTQEQGKPLPAAMHEIGGAIAMIRAFAAMDLKAEVLRETDDVRIVRQRSPLGVVAAITPWNFPVILLMLKVPPALVAGNTVVVKPAPTTPLTTLRFGEICAEVLPPGVVNVIVDQNDLGGALTSHPDVAKVAFTGSTATGRKVMASAAPSLKHVTLELGGNDAAIVLDDLSPQEIAPKLFMGAMLNSGQICLAIKRAYVPE
jgi:acyl-CoA reductase-like NAD-dependent aldehyde dehydrogenase